MANLNYIIFCANVKNANDTLSGLSAEGLLPLIVMDNFPNMYSFSIVFSICEINANDNNKLRVTFGKEDKILADTGEIFVPANEDMAKFPIEFQGLNFSLDLKNLKFEEEGLYKANVYLNGILLGDKEINVLTNPNT